MLQISCLTMYYILQLLSNLFVKPGEGNQCHQPLARVLGALQLLIVKAQKQTWSLFAAVGTHLFVQMGDSNAPALLYIKLHFPLRPPFRF